MPFAARIILVLTLLLAIAVGLSAQETTTATAEAATTTETSATTTAEASAETPARRDNYQTRSSFTQLLHEHPSELWMLLKLDPGLLTNEPFLAQYPELRSFLADHPEVLRNPRFYLVDFEMPGRNPRSAINDIAEMMAVLGSIALGAFALIWMIRAIIEQRRWNRLARTQSDVHNKILDRFSTSNELLEYIKTAAGTKFLESAPIPLRVEPSEPQSGPLTRIMWSIQIGVIIAAGGLGMLLVSFSFDGETAQGLFAMGAIGFCLGGGFIASALVSLFLSRRLNSWQADLKALQD